jgi:hypothetical protein
MLKDTDKLNHLKRQLFGLRDVLGGTGASARVADIAFDMLKQ